MPNAQTFWDNTAAKYAASPVKNQQAYEATLARTRSYLTKDDTVLELGCGTGTTALLLADSVKHIVATDISANMIDIAQEKATDQRATNVTFRQAELFEAARAERTYDVVMAFNLLHLVEDTEAAMRRFNELLKPGGLFISKTICLGESRMPWMAVIFVMRLFGFAPFVRSLKIAELEAMVADAGFQIIETGLYPANRANRFIVAKKP